MMSNGILLVNKPQGLSSNLVLQKVKRLYQIKKAGHTGSLDPLATGMLPICFGEATKVSQYLLDADKAYQATGLLGIKTTTADALGEVIAKVSNVQVSLVELQQTLQAFLGTITQVPSMFSALKHQGQPLYRLARRGITIERAARNIEIKQLELLDFDGLSFTIQVICSKGTYIRNLVEDIGEHLGVHAHVTALHRIFTAGFTTEKMYTLEALTAMDEPALRACLLPMERAVAGFPRVSLSGEDRRLLQQGRELRLDLATLGTLCLLDENGAFIGLGDYAEGVLRVRRLLAI